MRWGTRSWEPGLAPGGHRPAVTLPPLLPVAVTSRGASVLAPPGCGPRRWEEQAGPPGL